VRNFLLGVFVATGFWFAYYSAAQDYLIGSGVAIHLDGAKHCNWFTKGLGIEKSVSESWRIAAGYYDNSNCRDSFYLAGAWLPLRLGDLRLGVIGGGVTGYRAPILPAGGLVAAYEPGKYGVNVIFIPPAGESGQGVIWLQANLAF